MRVEIVADREALARRAAGSIIAAVRAKPDALLGFPTGDTPIATYAEIERRAAAGEADFARATVYAVDEFAGVARSTAGTNSAFFREHLRIRLRALHIPNPAASDLAAHIRAYAEAIRRAGGLDLCVLGIGRNGHIAFNEPGSPAGSRARLVELEPVSREAHAAAFGSLASVPQRGLTLGVADLLDARAILVLASGSTKAAIVRAAVEDPPSPEVPASWLQTHPDVTWLLDADAAAKLRSPAR